MPATAPTRDYATRSLRLPGHLVPRLEREATLIDRAARDVEGMNGIEAVGDVAHERLGEVFGGRVRPVEPGVDGPAPGIAVRRLAHAQRLRRRHRQKRTDYRQPLLFV